MHRPQRGSGSEAPWVGRLGLAGVLLVSACSSSIEDGKGGGGAPAQDGGAGGQAPTKVHVTVVGSLRDNPIGDFDVVSNDANGAVVDSGLTHADGTADLAVPSGGSISVVALIPFPDVGPDHAERHVKTISFDGPPTDTARFRLSLPDDPQETMAVTVYYPPKAGAESYWVVATCAGSKETSSSVAGLDLLPCTADGLFDVLVVALDSAHRPVDYALTTGEELVPGEHLALDLSWSHASPTTTHLTAKNIPTGASTLDARAQDALWRDFGSAFFTDRETVHAPEGSYAGDLSHFGALGAHCDSIEVRFASAWDGALRRVCSEVIPAELAFDVSRLSRMQPHLVSGDPLRMQLTEAWPGETGDVLLVDVSGTDAAGELPEHWSIYRSAVTNGELRFPDLPAELSAFVMPADGVAGYTATHVDLDALATFEAAVERGLPAFDADRSLEATWLTIGL